MAVFITAERILDMFIFWLPLYNEVTLQALRAAAHAPSATACAAALGYTPLFPAQSRATAHYLHSVLAEIHDAVCGPQAKLLLVIWLWHPRTKVRGLGLLSGTLCTVHSCRSWRSRLAV